MVSRVTLALRAGFRLLIEPSTASFLIAVDKPRQALLQAVGKLDNETIAVCVFAFFTEAISSDEAINDSRTYATSQMADFEPVLRKGRIDLSDDFALATDKLPIKQRRGWDLNPR